MRYNRNNPTPTGLDQRLKPLADRLLSDDFATAEERRKVKEEYQHILAERGRCVDRPPRLLSISSIRR